MKWLLTIPIASLFSDGCMSKKKKMSHAKEGVLLRTRFDNVYILRVNNASTSFFTQFNSYLPHILLKFTSFLLHKYLI